MLSRIAGLLREATIGVFLGTDVMADAFRIGFTLPNLMRRLVGEGAVTSAFVAVYSRHVRHDGDDDVDATGDGIVFAEKFLTLWVLLVASIVVLGVLGIGLGFHWLARLKNLGDLNEPANLALTIEVSRILFWYLFFIGTAAAAQGILNARWKFGAPAFVSTLFNLVFVGSTFSLAPFFSPDKAVFALSFAILAGGFVQLAALIPALWRLGVRFRPRSPFNHSGITEVLRLMVPGILGAGVYQINVAVNILIAIGIGTGAASSLGYSNRFMEFVLGVFVVALSTVSLTSLARIAARKDAQELATRSEEVLRLILFITIPSTFGLYLLREPLISFVLQWEGGAFDEDSLRMTAAAFQCHILGLAFVGLVRPLVATFHAQRDMLTPVIVSLVVVPLNIALAFLLSATTLAHAGIALASTLATVVHAGILLTVYRRRLPEFRLRELLRSSLRIALATSAMAIICLVLLYFLPAPTSKLLLGLWIALVVTVGAGSYFGLAAVTRMPEWATLWRSFRHTR